MDWKYWRVLLSYGHVGKRNEVSVARFLVTSGDSNPVAVMEIALEMPGVKHRGVVSVTQISQEEYILGHRQEAENLYLQKLKSFKPRKIIEETSIHDAVI